MLQASRARKALRSQLSCCQFRTLLKAPFWRLRIVLSGGHPDQDCHLLCFLQPPLPLLPCIPNHRYECPQLWLHEFSLPWKRKELPTVYYDPLPELSSQVAKHRPDHGYVCVACACKRKDTLLRILPHQSQTRVLPDQRAHEPIATYFGNDLVNVVI